MSGARRLWNPFRSEAEAYRFLIMFAAYAASIVISSLLGGRWAGLAVFTVLSTAAVALGLRRGRPDEPATPLSVSSPGADRHILVIANETVAGEPLIEAIRTAASVARTQVLVVCPALNTRLRHWASDDDDARTQAQQRLDQSLARLATLGITARGEIGDSDPLQAAEDALRTFGADELIISTHPEGRSNWLEHDIIGRARAAFDVPITHITVDLGTGR